MFVQHSGSFIVTAPTPPGTPTITKAVSRVFAPISMHSDTSVEHTTDDEEPLDASRSRRELHAQERDGDRDALPLSIVIITENEQDRIGACIESVMTAARTAVPSFEVILVDSASTDRTLEIAGEYPITILQIPDAETISCGAGRYVGDHAARGELVLHVDGDMRLTDSWLAAAVDALETDPDVAAVEGWLNESNDTAVRDVLKVGGVMCYDADALAAVGGFDPFLHGNEDVDVGYRLTAAGYRLLRLPSVSAEHPTADGAFTEPLRRWRHGYLLAPGQTIRKSLGRPRVLHLLIARQQYKFLLLAWLALGLAAVASTILFGGWLVASTLGFAAVARRRGVRGATQLGLSKLLGLVGLVQGLGHPSRSPDEFPLDTVTHVQTGSVLPGTSGADTDGTS